MSNQSDLPCGVCSSLVVPTADGGSRCSNGCWEMTKEENEEWEYNRKVEANPQPGDMYRVWWDCGDEKINGWHHACIMEVRPYEGRFTEHFRFVLKLQAPNTRRGWTEMAVA